MKGLTSSSPGLGPPRGANTEPAGSVLLLPAPPADANRAERPKPGRRAGATWGMPPVASCSSGRLASGCSAVVPAGWPGDANAVFTLAPYLCRYDWAGSASPAVPALLPLAAMGLGLLPSSPRGSSAPRRSDSAAPAGDRLTVAAVMPPAAPPPRSLRLPLGAVVMLRREGEP